MAYNPLKALGYYFDSYFSGLAAVIGLKGNTLPINIVTIAPQGTPPGGVGVQFFVDPTTHAVTVYVWDGSAWQVK